MTIRLWALIRKEFLAVMLDPKTRSILIIPPLLQLFIFSYAATLEVKNVTIAVYNQDGGHRSVELIKHIEASPTFTHINYVHSSQEIKNSIVNQTSFVALVIRSDFSQRIESKQSASLQVILDGRKSNTALITLGYLNDIMDAYTRDLAQEFNYEFPQLQIIERHWFNANLIYMWFTVPSLLATLVMTIALSLTALSIARERDTGTFDQMLVSPLTPTEILCGKAIPAIIIATLEGVAICVFAIIFLRVKFQGNFFLFLGSLFVFLIAIVGIGLFISSLCRTQQQAALGSFMFMTPAVMISGFASPVENMPLLLQWLAQGSPLKHFMIVARGIFLKDMPGLAVWQHTWPNILIGIVTLMLAKYLFRRQA